MNKLKSEKSPYLLEHSDNPVDWYPWGDEAFNRAKNENKPVFLSIGYSTCHWCHVMENESFTDNEVAEKLNNTFVCIKVDREERPDIDNIYMTMSQMMTGSGGWPLNIILTPDKKPIFAFTYIPRNSRNNMIGMIDLCNNINDLWKNKRNELEENGNKVIAALESHENIKYENREINYEDVIQKTFKSMENNYDNEYGGFGSSPKFPSFQHLIFLMNYYKRYNSNKALAMVENTLKKMYIGGIYDHVGYGFHRYSTDSLWRIPHFEKMGYDQAMAIMAYTYAYSITKNKFYRDVVYEIFTFLKNEMFNKAFYTAIDADSENEEGKYYTWAYDEIKRITDDEFIDLFNVTNKGNFFDNNYRATGKNILYLKENSDNGYNKKINEDLKKLYDERNKRIKPLKDDKILSDVNGLIIKSLSIASMIFNDKEMLDYAEKAADFIMNNMYRNDVLYHRYRDGDVSIEGFLDDYAFLSSGLLELYEATLNEIYLKYAGDLNRYVKNNFYDKLNGGFYESGSNIIVKLKETYDNAIPSGFSTEIDNLVILNYINGGYYDVIDKSLKNIYNDLNREPMFFSHTVSAFFKILNYYKIDTGNEEVINYLKSTYPYNHYLIKSSNSEINVCDENKCFIIKDITGLKKLIS